MGIHRPKLFNHKEMGERSEAIIMRRLAHAGYTVLKPLGENQRYDLIIEDAERKFWRVQCKTAWLNLHIGFLLGTLSSDIPVQNGECL